MKCLVCDFIETRTGHHPADLRLFPKREQIWHDTKMFAAPVATGCAHAALHLVEDQKDIGFVANLSQFLQPFAAEMIIAAFALDRLDDDCADVDLALLDELSNLALSLLFALDYIGFALQFRQRKIDARTRHPRPIELCKQIRLARISIREAHRVAASPMKRATEVQNLCAALAMASRHVFAHLPIHRRFQTILDRKRATFDEKITLQRR